MEISKPHPGIQQFLAASNTDLTWGAGDAGCGKSYALLYALAQPLLTDPDFRALISRKSLQNQKAGGGFVDTFKDIFGEYVQIRESDSPRAAFESGAFCDMTYIDDTNLDKMRERAKGWQYDAIIIDEITEMSWQVFTYLQTRNRGRSKTFTGKFFATFNPKRKHWSRTFIDWYIGYDGHVIPERNGTVRFFYINGKSVKDVVWGNSKEEVYLKCQSAIDKKLKEIGGNFSYQHLIKSFSFYVGTIAENTTLTKENPGYIGSIAASGGATSAALLGANFNADPDEEEIIPIKTELANNCFTNDNATNGELWITADLADYGTDNTLFLAWNGLHVYDAKIHALTTPKDNATALLAFAREHNTPTNRIIFDATAAMYIKDYIPDAVPYRSSSKAIGLYKYTGVTIKDICYLRLVSVITNGHLTFSQKVAQMRYIHQNIKYVITFENEFLDETAVVRFEEMRNGAKRLLPKKKMNALLGLGRSMDLLDPCAMRMLPYTNVEYGSELEYNPQQKLQHTTTYAQNSIYDDTCWA